MTSEQEECEAVPLLQEWLPANKRSQVWLAKACGVTPPSVNDWLRRVSRPVPHLRDIIEVATNGAVKAVAWEFPSERASRDQAIRRIRAEAQAEVSGDAA